MKLLGICGSLRKNSYNMMALRACAELLPEGVSIEFFDLADIPMYNQDVFDTGLPEPVARLRAAISAADGLVISTPEYNFSLPAVLKNAIDWASREPQQSFKDKPVAIFSAATGPLGGARVQYDLRRMLTPLWAMTLPRPEVFIGNAASKFDANGKLTDETTAKFLREQMVGFKAWIERVQPR